MDETSAESGRVAMRAVGEISGSFFVPGYQRGYRWGAHEVRALLDDLWAFIEEGTGETYCLQPVVLKRKGESAFELVDGQQRLTTLLILARYLQRAEGRGGPRYAITYETRDRSRDFLDSLSPELVADKARAEANIDYAHMSRAWTTVAAWFAAQAKRGLPSADVATRLLDALATRVKVIWYEAPGDVDGVALFTRLNAGRIPLTSAELLKAVLLAADARVSPARRDEVAAQWDAIERELGDEDYWSFLRSPDAPSLSSRIELLFELLADLPGARRVDPYLLFESLGPRAEGDREGFWREALTLRATLREWYEDHALYHRVGYLIAVGTPLRELWRDAAGASRQTFRARVEGRIEGRVNPGKKKARALSFDADGALCDRLLLLANVEAVRRRGTGERYPFGAHKARRWSLEHVNPQSGDAVRTTEDRRRWLAVHRRALEDYPWESPERAAERTKLLRRIDIAASDLDGAGYADVANDVAAFFSPREALHDIGNLALLAGDDNSALSNATFAVKQQRVIEMDRDGSFIPPLTLRVFLKFDSPPAHRHIPRWGDADREAYLDLLFAPKTGLLARWMPEESLT